MPIHCQIITPERKVFEDDVDIVLAPAAQGRLGILPNHAPLITALAFGELTVRQGDFEETFAIDGGVLQVSENRVIVLADFAEMAEEINVALVEDARRRAEQIMSEGPPADPDDLAALEAAIRRAELQIKVARRSHPRRGTGPSGMSFGSQEADR